MRVFRDLPKSVVVGAAIILAVIVLAAGSAVGVASPTESTLPPHCRAGAVSLTGRPGRLVFSVHCDRRRRGKVGFVIGRGDGNGLHVTIRSFSPEPPTTGDGAVYRRGRCTRTRQQVACQAYADGPIEIHGLLTVPRRTECHSRIDITQVIECESEGHGAPCWNLLIDRIYDGRPKGC